MMMPITGTIVHCPANQCCTAVYQSSVVGRNTKPSTGHNGLLNTLNQCENSHTSTITTRGTHNASNTSRQGMAESFRGFGQLDATRSGVAGGSGRGFCGADQRAAGASPAVDSQRALQRVKRC